MTTAAATIADRSAPRWPPEPPDEAIEEIARIVRERLGPVGGPWTRRVEASMSDLTGGAEAIAFPTCSSAIEACVDALDLATGAAVLVPAFTFVGTVAGASATQRLVFADVDADTLTLDDEFVAAGGPGSPGLAIAEAVIAVDLHGVPHRFPRAAIQGRPVITDACQSLGTLDRFGNHLGCVGTHCWSFSPSKAAPATGGGCVTTEDQFLAEQLRCIRDYGLDSATTGQPRAHREAVRAGGRNLLPSEIDMCLAWHQLQDLERWATRMHEVGELLRAAAVEGGLRVQGAGDGTRVAWHKIRVGDDRRSEADLERFLYDERGLVSHRWGLRLDEMRAFGGAAVPVIGVPNSRRAERMVCLGTEDAPHWTWTDDEIEAACAALRRPS